MKLAALQQVCNDLTEVETLKGCMVHKIKTTSITKISMDIPFLNWNGKHAEYNTLLLKGLIKCVTA